MIAPANCALKNRDSYQETLAWLFGLQRFGIKLGLDTMKCMLQELGNPQDSFGSIHIAGSNGKGSTAAFISAICQKAGYRIGLYTSPHLADYSERIRIDGEPIPQEAVVRLTKIIRARQRKAAREHTSPRAFPSVMDMTFFEFTTVMAFLYFKENKVDLAVIEVGMGGRLDATNIVQPLIAVITSITREHEQYLGKHLEQIALEKAGIIKSGTPVLTAVRQPALVSLYQEICARLGAPLYRIGKDIRIKKQGAGKFHYYGLFAHYPSLVLNMYGDYQFSNAALAVSAVELLRKKGYLADETAVRTGLKDMHWPARLELVNDKPRVFLDGAHNLGAVRRLRKELQLNFTYRRLILVIGIMKDKAIKPMLRLLVSLADTAILTRPRLERSADPATMLGYIPCYQKKVEIIEDVKAAVRTAMSSAQSDDLICVTGSLFTAGEAREVFFKKVDV